MKFYKGIGDAVIEVSGKWINVRYTIGGEAYFVHNDRRYKLSNFIRIKNNSWVNYPDYLQEFDGIANEGYNSDLIKINEGGDRIKFFTFRYKNI